VRHLTWAAHRLFMDTRIGAFIAVVVLLAMSLAR
jgi:hypothetical protein